MKSLIVSILCVVLLSACGDSVKQNDIDFAKKVCENNGGLVSIDKGNISILWPISVRCSNGAKFEATSDYKIYLNNIKDVQ